MQVGIQSENERLRAIKQDLWHLDLTRNSVQTTKHLLRRAVGVAENTDRTLNTTWIGTPSCECAHSIPEW